MSIGYSTKAKAEISAIVNGRVHFDSITIKKNEFGNMVIEYIHEGNATMWQEISSINFDAGDTLTIASIEGSSPFYSWKESS